jgi:hypothetical protein
MLYHNKNDIKDNPLALCDFLSLRENDSLFTEKYVREIVSNSSFFVGQDLEVVTSQNKSEPDLIDKLNKQNIYEVKTFWKQKGCEMLSNGIDFKQTYKELSFNEDLDFQFNNWDKPNNYNKSTQNLIEKMKKKPMNYILFMLNTFSLKDRNLFTFEVFTDIDAIKWQYILKVNNFSFKIFVIKPTILNQFAINRISQTSIQEEIISYNDFFSKYITTNIINTNSKL